MNKADQRDYSKHPCFNAKVKGQFGRVHLPVAPNCNIKCNYCNRKYDCVNESRPGVTSNLLSPGQALVYVEKVVEKEPRITVAGIAGPGDPFANAAETLETMRLIRARFPEMILCLSSNGLALAKHVDEIAAIGVSHVTVTVNAVDPEVGKNIYGWVRDGKIIYRGLQAAELLLARQIEAIGNLKRHGVIVKINTVVVPGINDQHITAIAKKMRSLGVDLLNCMAMFPNAGTPFGEIIEPDKKMLNTIRRQAEKYLPQMRHCTRCRADAVGLLGKDQSSEMAGCLSACSRMPMKPKDERPYVAVASMEGVLINQHLGEAKKLQIWAKEGGSFKMVEERETPEAGCGPRRWLYLSRTLNDCRAVVVSGIGTNPKNILEKYGIRTYIMNGFIELGLEAVFSGRRDRIEAMRGRAAACADKIQCAGGGGGCL
ncbi:MAG: nitrogenase cofactor biosynthesis protein NifB [Deltaproteobacteria bacterium]|nr:nitrogenase cofactor biosynthesis protein NifB [Deltaproteobacteria bacterium]